MKTLRGGGMKRCNEHRNSGSGTGDEKPDDGDV
jgi:hypothetical protein